MTRALLVALSVLLLPGCSTVKLVYNNLDTLANWAVDDAVGFSGEQEALFDTEFAALWGWHRHTQLARYAGDLRELAAAVEQPLSPVEVQAYSQRIRGHAFVFYEAALPRAARLLARLDDAQVDLLLEKTREQRDEQHPPQQTPEQRREKRVAEMNRGLKTWIGKPTEAQRARIVEWAVQHEHEPESARDFQTRWEAAFKALMATRAQPDFEQRLHRHFDEVPEYRDPSAQRIALANRDRWFGLMSDLSGLLTPKQRGQFQQRLRDLADDLDELAAETATE